MIDLIVTSLRQDLTQRLIESVSKGTIKPGMVSIVSNEIDSLDPMGLNVRVIKFTSNKYPIGYKDVVVRCNVGLYASEHQYVMFAGEDHVAAKTTIADSINLFAEKDYWWGHHRITTFADKDVDTIQGMLPHQGVSREHGVNRQHLYQSCYSGSFGAKAQVLRDVGGFDMAFACRHGGEDQQLGRRLAQKFEGTDKVFIHEPPYWWHPQEKEPWGKTYYINTCLSKSDHDTVPVKHGEFVFEACKKCPYYSYIGPSEMLYTVSNPILRYKHDNVEIEITPVKKSLRYLTRV